ncbi:MAG: CDP-alcohol phosphatidyltransferase family protein [Phycisphaerales bacterium]
MNDPRSFQRPAPLRGDRQDASGEPRPPRGMRMRLRRRSNRRPLPGVKVLPTMMTLGNLLCGFAAIYYSARAGESGGATPFGWHPLTVAGTLVFLGMAFDAIDGSLARLTRSTSDLGAQLDSLADVVTFGVAPAFMMLRLVGLYYGPGDGILVPDTGNMYSRICWSIAAIYICCTALRLARFNVESTSADEQDHRWFKGLPSPGAGGTVASLALLHQHLVLVLWPEKQPPGFAATSSMVIPAVTLLCAFAMVSRMRYPHFVNRYLKGRKSLPQVAVMLVVVAVAAWWFHETLALALVGYALSGPILAMGGRKGALAAAGGADAAPRDDAGPGRA